MPNARAKYNASHNEDRCEKKEVAHFLLTSFNCNLPYLKQGAPDDAWLLSRFDLFERFCLPSVAAQTSREFQWLVFFDLETSEPFRKRIDEYRKLDVFDPIFFEECRDTSFVCDWIRRKIDGKCATVVTTHLDNDDAISNDFLSKIREAACSLQGERCFLNIPNGYVWFEERVYWSHYPRNPFFSVVEPLEDLSTVISYDHTKIRQFGPIVELYHPGANLQVIHGRNRLNRLPDIRCRVRKSQLHEYFNGLVLGPDDSIPGFLTEKVTEAVRNPAQKLRKKLRKRFRKKPETRMK